MYSVDVDRYMRTMMNLIQIESSVKMVEPLMEILIFASSGIYKCRPLDGQQGTEEQLAQLADTSFSFKNG